MKFDALCENILNEDKNKHSLQFELLEGDSEILTEARATAELLMTESDEEYEQRFEEALNEARRRRRRSTTYSDEDDDENVEFDYQSEIADIEGRLAELTYQVDKDGQFRGKTPKEKLNTILDFFQLVLDSAGLIPGAEPLDLINAVIYMSRGKWGDSLISLISAIPLMDFAKLLKAHKGTKAGKIMLKVIKPLHKALKAGKLMKIFKSAKVLRFAKSAKTAAKGLQLGRIVGDTKIFLNRYFKKYIRQLQSIVPFTQYAIKAGDIKDLKDLSILGDLKGV